MLPSPYHAWLQFWVKVNQQQLGGCHNATRQLQTHRVPDRVKSTDKNLVAAVLWKRQLQTQRVPDWVNSTDSNLEAAIL